jgi:hypothetical protein
MGDCNLASCTLPAWTTTQPCGAGAVAATPVFLREYRSAVRQVSAGRTGAGACTAIDQIFRNPQFVADVVNIMVAVAQETHARVGDGRPFVADGVTIDDFAFVTVLSRMGLLEVMGPRDTMAVFFFHSVDGSMHRDGWVGAVIEILSHMNNLSLSR